MSEVLRRMTVDDIPAALQLSTAAGWNQTDEDWRFLLEGNPGRFVVAVRDGRVIGSGGAVCYGSALAWVCMILVDPDQRGHGIGTRIVEGVLDRLTDIAACAGARNLEGPGWEDETYYAAFFEDPCGNRLELCHRTAPVKL